MISIDLFELQRHFNAQRIMLCFNGPLSASLIEEIGKALRNYLESQTDSANASTPTPPRPFLASQLPSAIPSAERRAPRESRDCPTPPRAGPSRDSNR